MNLLQQRLHGSVAMHRCRDKPQQHWPSQGQKGSGAWQRQRSPCASLLRRTKVFARRSSALRNPEQRRATQSRSRKPEPVACGSRRVVGLQVVSGMVPAGENRWKGHIYNADDGGTYSLGNATFGNTMNLRDVGDHFAKRTVSFVSADGIRTALTGALIQSGGWNGIAPVCPRYLSHFCLDAREFRLRCVPQSMPLEGLVLCQEDEARQGR